MNCGNSAPKKTTAKGLAIEVMKPCRKRRADMPEELASISMLVSLDLIKCRPIQARKATPIHLIQTKALADVAMTAARPNAAHVICMTLA